MKGRGVRIALTVLLGLGLGGAFYFLFIFPGREHQHVEANGWVLDRSYVRMRCRPCSSRIERLEYAGIAPPKIAPGSRTTSVFTPVGVFYAYFRFEEWFYSTAPLSVTATGPAVGPEDIVRGWYEMSEPYYSPTLYQRTGTPSHWALVSGAQHRWCEPRLIGECAVAVSQPPATQTSPAE